MKWVDINRELPEIIHADDGSVNCVLVRWVVAPECGHDYIVANTEWVCGRGKSEISHWMEIPEIDA